MYVCMYVFTCMYMYTTIQVLQGTISGTGASYQMEGFAWEEEEPRSTEVMSGARKMIRVWMRGWVQERLCVCTLKYMHVSMCSYTYMHIQILKSKIAHGTFLSVFS
jgi:hypothetical protein